MSSCRVVSRPVGEVWLRDYLLCFAKMATCMWPTTLPSFSTATACRSKEFSFSTALQSFVDLRTQIRGRGGLNCEVKVQVLIVTPSPLFFLELGRKKEWGSMVYATVAFKSIFRYYFHYVKRGTRIAPGAAPSAAWPAPPTVNADKPPLMPMGRPHRKLTLITAH